MKGKLKKLLKLNLSLTLYAVIIAVIVSLISYIGFYRNANRIINNTCTTIENNLNKNDIEELKDYAATIFSSMERLDLKEGEYNRSYIAQFGHLKDYEEYKAINTSLSLIRESNPLIEDLSLIYTDIDNNRMLYLCESGHYDLGVIRKFDYNDYNKLILKKNPSIGKIDGQLALYKGASIFNNNISIATISLYISLSPFFSNLALIWIICLLITIITNILISLFILRLPALYKRASIYLKANEEVIRARKEEKIDKARKKKELKLKRKNTIDEDLETDFKDLVLNEEASSGLDNKAKEVVEEIKEEKKEDIKEEIKEDIVEDIGDNKPEDKLQKVDNIKENEKSEDVDLDTDSNDLEPKSKARKLKEGEEEKHPVIDWIVDQL